MALHQILFLDLAQEIEHFLGAAHGEAGDDQVAAPVEGVLQDGGQGGHIVWPGAVAAVAVGGLHHHIVRLMDGLGVPQQGLMGVADVAGKDDLAGLLPFGDPQLDGRGAQKVAHVGEAGADVRPHLHRLAVVHFMEQGQGGLGVLHGVKGLILLAAGAFGLAVAPLGLELLDVGGVAQHDAAQLGGGPGGEDRAFVAVLHHQGDAPGVVDVGVGQQHAVHLAGGQGQGLVLVDVAALLHAAVHHQVETAGLQKIAAAGDLVGGA